MGVFLYATSFFGAAGVLAFVKKKKKETKVPPHKHDLVTMKLNVHRYYKSKDIKAANNAYQVYIAALEDLIQAKAAGYEDELHNVRIEYGLFKRKNRISNQDDNAEADREVTPELRKISRLLQKEAELYIENDPNTSLDLLQSAACFNPDKSLKPEIKIAQINYKLGKADEAFATYEHILQTMDRGNLKDFHTKSKEICEKINVKKFKEDQFNDYLYYYCKWMYHHVMQTALNGRVNEVNTILGATDKLGYGVPTKMHSCFTRLGKTYKRQQFNDSVNLYFDKHSNQIKQIAQCASRQNSRGATDQAQLMANELTPENFEFYYHNRIKLTLE